MEQIDETELEVVVDHKLADLVELQQDEISIT